MSKALIREFMTSNVTSIAVTTPLAEMAEIMKNQQLTSVVVVEHGLPIGIISERDMSNLCAQLLSGGKAPELRQMMSAKLVCINAEKTCEQAAKIMQKQKIRHMITTDPTGILCGIFNQSDLLRASHHEVEQQHSRTAQKVFQLNQSLEDSQQKLEQLSKTDALLNIGNRMAMDEALSATAKREAPYSVLVIDIDYFKRYNDYYNHSHGDEVLQRVCRSVQLALQNRATLYRQSGNTLLALFCDDTDVDKYAFSEQILQGVSDLQISHTTAPLGKISVSLGIASCYTPASEPNHVVFRALSARDMAKQYGGNQVFEDTEHQQRAA